MDNFYKVLWIFFLYSFIGWILETVVAVAKKKKFVNRGVLNGPLCCVYGIAALVITVGMRELRDSWFFLFLGSMIIATFMEWASGKLLEKMHHHRWWDYSGKKWNMDGYICLQYSLLWGVLGAVSLKYINPLFFRLYDVVPGTVRRVILLAALGCLAVDMLGSYAAIFHIADHMPEVTKVNNRIGAATLRLGNWITGHVESRMAKAHPSIGELIGKKGSSVGQTAGEKAKSVVFAQGCSFYKLVSLFFIGAFLGDLIETVFCRVTAGVWMSRSSVVWGPFSIVWGLAIVLATLILYNYRNKSDGFLFIFGTVLGGAYEYLCSVFTEIAFGTVFWDYSEIPFNLGGRINLLYCFFWGIAAVVWLKILYPVLSRYIEKIPMKAGKWMTWILLVFMLVNMCVSVMALSRYSERAQGIPAQSGWEQTMDERFADERMERIYPNAIRTDS